MADRQETEEDHGVQQVAEVQEGTDEEEAKKVGGEGERRTEGDEVCLQWPWLKRRASIVAAFCFIIVLVPTVSLPLLLVRNVRTGANQVWDFLDETRSSSLRELYFIPCSIFRRIPSLPDESLLFPVAVDGRLSILRCHIYLTQ